MILTKINIDELKLAETDITRSVFAMLQPELKDVVKDHAPAVYNPPIKTQVSVDVATVATSGSYNDLSNKPLSVESSKVKYTLSDGTTKLTLAQESDIKDIGIDFTSSAVSGNIVSGETLAVMMKKIYRKERYLSCELPYLQYSDLPSQSTNTETACKEWLQYIVTNHWSEIQDQVLYLAPFRPNSSGFVVGYFYATYTPNAQHFPSYCSFILLGISSSTLFQKFGTNNYTFYFLNH